MDDSDGEEDLLLGRQLDKGPADDLAAIAARFQRTFEGMFAFEGFKNDFTLHQNLQQNEIESVKASLSFLKKLDQSLKSEPLAHTVAIPVRGGVSLRDPEFPSLSPDPNRVQGLVFFDRFSDQPFASLHLKVGFELAEITRDDYLAFFKTATAKGLSLVFSQFLKNKLKDRYKAFLAQPNQYFCQFESPFCAEASSLLLRGIKHNPADLDYLSTYASLMLAFFRMYHDLLAYFIRFLSSKERNSHFDRFHLLYFGVELDAVKALNGKFCTEFFSEVTSDYQRL